MTAEPPADDTPDLALVRGLLAAYEARDLEAALPLMAADVVLELETTARMAGRHAPYVGHDGVRDYFADMLRVWDDIELMPERWDAVDGTVVVTGHARGRIGGQELFAAARWEYVIRDGRIAHVRQKLDPRT